MKLIPTLGAVALAAFSYLPLNAQARTIVYGRTTVQFSSSFQQTLSGLGATITDISGNPLKSGAAIFRATSGVIDLQTAVGEVAYTGGYVVSAGGTTITIQNLVLDTSVPVAPVLTGFVTVNSTVRGRFPVFALQPSAGFTLPLQSQVGIAQINGFTLTLAPATAGIFNNVFGGPVLTAGAAVGTADVYAVLSSEKDAAK